MIYGYARVSTTGQTLDIQLALLHEASCEKIFSEKLSGMDAARPQLRRLLRALKPGDALVVTRLDRFARSVRDLLNLIAVIQLRQSEFRSLAESIDISSPLGKLVLTVVGAFAEFEWAIIRQRTLEGRISAAQLGVAFGRKPKLDSLQRQAALTRRMAGESQAVIAKAYDVSCSTISRLR